MLITRTPLRISIGGGGTDLPSFYERREGFVISAAINKYVYIALNKTFTDDYLLKYSELERRRSIDEIGHPIIREALRIHGIDPGLEMVSIADIPAGAFYDFGRDLFPKMLTQGDDLRAYYLTDYVLDIGTVEKYAQSQLEAEMRGMAALLDRSPARVRG